MILLSGTLQTSTPSTQALLRCDLGTFSVLDERLESVSAGDHDGLFEIESIKPHLLPSHDGTIQLGVIAVLKRFSLLLLDQPVKTAAKKARLPLVNQVQCSLFMEGEEISSSEVENDESLDQATDRPLGDEPVPAVTATAVVVETMFTPVKTGSSVDIVSVNASDQKLVVNTVIEVTVSDKVLFGIVLSFWKRLLWNPLNPVMFCVNSEIA